MADPVPALTGNDLTRLAKQALNDDYHHLHPAWIEHHLLLLTSLRKIFGNDLDKPIILAVIGQVMFAHGEARENGYAGALAYEEDVRTPVLTNIESISLSTGIPRESVRRKVCELVEAGWVKRDEKGRIFTTVQAARELNGTTQIAFTLLADMFAKIAKSVEKNGSAEVGTCKKCQTLAHTEH